MATAILTESDVFGFLGRMTSFKSDNLLCHSEGKNYYYWRKGEPCCIAGFLKTPDADPLVMIFYGKDMVDTEEVPLEHLRDVVSVSF